MSLFGPLMECCSNRRNNDEEGRHLGDRGQLSEKMRRGIAVDMYQRGKHDFQRKETKHQPEFSAIGSHSPRLSNLQDSPRIQDLQMHSPRDNVGVGIIFDAGTDGKGPDGIGLCVNGLSPDGPADQCKSIHIGDVLVEIDGVDVQGKTAGEISSLILGRPGSSVHLKFFSRGRFDRPYHVTMERKRTVNRRLKLPHD